jgi:hypothetical protein
MAYYISQGQSRYHEATVPSGTTTLDLKLDWGNTQSKLSLTPYDPDGTKINTYYDDDDSDGINGKISIRISSKEGMESGVWKFKVKGVSVVGREDYTFGAAAHQK